MFVYVRKAHYHETDMMGVVHHSNYLKWMEEARIAFMDFVGTGYAEVEKNSIVSPVTSVTVDYKKPVRFDDEIEIRLSVKAYTGIRLEIGYEMFNRTKNELCTAAASKHCFLKDGRVISMKKERPDLDAVFTGYLSGDRSE
ncbi:MAG: acyl-CoA thioesterase [Clostridia bacterium]|nr:acyl-CoA thioesterase [Clostridia bacterium]